MNLESSLKEIKADLLLFKADLDAVYADASVKAAAIELYEKQKRQEFLSVDAKAQEYEALMAEVDQKHSAVIAERDAKIKELWAAYLA